MSNFLPPALAALADYAQFVIYEVRQKPNGKSDKVPLDPHSFRVSGVTDRKIWMSVDVAGPMVQALGKPYGLGFAMTPEDPFFFVDIDQCLEPNGKWSPLATDILDLFSGAGVEVSQSGKGLHIIGRAIPPENHRCRNEKEFPGLELYTEGRLIALTGVNTLGDSRKECTQQLDAFLLHYMPPVSTAVAMQDAGWTETPDPRWKGYENDDELLQKAMSSSSAGSVFGGRATFRDLFEANVEKLSVAYPTETPGSDFDHSSADRALAQHLAFWTGNNCERIHSLMFRSALVREKWDRPDYLRERTIPSAVGSQATVYTGRQDSPLVAPMDASSPGAVQQDGFTSGSQYLSPREQQEYFAGCVYVRDQHRIFVPDGGLLKAEQFRATYGGFTFALDATNVKVTKSAWEAFTESQAVRFPIATTLGFRPDQPPGQILETEGRTVLNTYVPIKTRAIPGDASPFYDWFARFLPDESDRTILWAYMASMVQNPGSKFQWWPFIQGQEGNGKTTLFRVLEHAIGQRYTHYPNALDLANVFNGWVSGKLFIGVEEIFVNNKKEMMEALKPIMTNDRIGIQFKGSDQFTGDNYANGMACSNYQEAVAITYDTRRWAPFFSAQQRYEDLVRDGMTGDFFPKLMKWLKADGYAILNHELRSYDIPVHLDPAKDCVVAPKTSSTRAAVVASLGSAEQEVIEAIEQGRPGFRGGWVSSIALSNLLESKRVASLVPQSRRRQMMAKLGYEWHPALMPNQGRTSGAVTMEGGKPKLFISTASPYMGIPTPQEVVLHYITDQGYTEMGP